MALSKEQEQFYQSTLEMTRKQIYDGACKMLGVENDLEKEDVAAE